MRHGVLLSALLLVAAGPVFSQSSVVSPVTPEPRPTLLPPPSGGVLTGPALPTQHFNRTDFFAQGFNLGLTLRYYSNSFCCSAKPGGRLGQLKK